MAGPFPCTSLATSIHLSVNWLHDNTQDCSSVKENNCGSTCLANGDHIKEALEMSLPQRMSAHNQPRNVQSICCQHPLTTDRPLDPSRRVPSTKSKNSIHSNVISWPSLAVVEDGRICALFPSALTCPFKYSFLSSHFWLRVFLLLVISSQFLSI